MLSGVFFSKGAVTGLLVTALLLVQGCVSARMSNHEADNYFRNGQYLDAAASLEKGLKDQGENGRDVLLYLLDLGLSMHSAGKFEESNQYFLKADKIADIKDYTSLSAEGATLLTSDNIKDYKGEDFEKVLINTYLAMNYALIGDVENALVEARRVNRKLYLMVTDGQRKYKQNAFARYVSGVLYETEGNWNDAYIDYKEAYKLEPEASLLRLDLWRTAYLSHLADEADQWDRQFNLTQADHQQALAGMKSEIIVIYENGISPVKRPNPVFYQIPKFYPRYNPVVFAQVLVNGEDRGQTTVLHNIETTAIENLDEKYAGIIAKKVAGVVAKVALSDEIERQTRSPLLGALARNILFVSDQADLRSWNLLPRDLQVARIAVPRGLIRLGCRPGVPVEYWTKWSKFHQAKKFL